MSPPAVSLADSPTDRKRAAPGPCPRSLPVHDARVLTDGCGMAEITLDGQRYTLRITRQGKLILTK